MTPSIRYLVDEHVAKAVAIGLRKRGIDVITVAEAGLLGAGDDELLVFADTEDRVIATQDRDFLRMAAEVKGNHPGIAYAPQGRSIGELVRLLDVLALVSNTKEMRGRVEFL